MRRPIILLPDGLARIDLTRGLFTVLDQADLSLVEGVDWHAYVRDDGNGFYARSRIGRMHRVIIGAKPGLLVDHRDGDGLNNRRSNLRVATPARNSQNRKALQKAHLPGVKLYPNGRFYAQINGGGPHKSLGGYATEQEAYEAYAREARRRYGDWAHPSLPNSES